ncbi:MAG: hypothetical protein LBH59_04540, partial [Planctomycetaceae bacterium]|nr:hypothetical protein [Planctomycetaceae bacterium]
MERLFEGEAYRPYRLRYKFCYKIPGSLTSIPLSAIFSDSIFGATSKAVALSIFFAFTRPFRLIVKSIIPSDSPIRIASDSFASFSSSISFR